MREDHLDCFDVALAAINRLRSEFEARPLSPGDALQLAERIYRQRRVRARYLPGHLFHEPAWDMLLDLFISEGRERPVSVSSVCIAADVPPTTALRWLATMEREGLIWRSSCERDGRRQYVRLTDDARAGMLKALSL